MNRLTIVPAGADGASRAIGRRRVRAAATGAAAVAVLGLAACSSSGSPAAGTTASPAAAGATSPSTTSPTHAGSGPVVFLGTVQVTGAVKSATKYTQKSSAASCAAAAAHGDMAAGGFKVPAPAGSPVINVVVAGFHGAGTYPPAEMLKDAADSIGLKAKAGGAVTKYVLTAHPAAGLAMGKEVLFLYKDGSGQLAFSDAHKLGQKSGPQIAGVISWTCTG